MKDTSINLALKGLGPQLGEGRRKHIRGGQQLVGRRGTGMEEVHVGIGMSDRGLHAAGSLLCLLKVLKPTRGKSSPKVTGLGQASAPGLRGHLEGTIPARHQLGMAGLAPISWSPSASKPWGSTEGGEEGHKWGERGVGLPGAKITEAADVGGLAALLPKAAQAT